MIAQSRPEESPAWPQIPRFANEILSQKALRALFGWIRKGTSGHFVEPRSTSAVDILVGAAADASLPRFNLQATAAA
jgi:hypothetical protein